MKRLRFVQKGCTAMIFCRFRQFPIRLAVLACSIGSGQHAEITDELQLINNLLQLYPLRVAPRALVPPDRCDEVLEADLVCATRRVRG